MKNVTEMGPFPVWKEKYEKIGVTPLELYMRQNGFCNLIREQDENGNIEIFCSDGNHKGITKYMLNPTIECVQCMIRFTHKAYEGK